MTLLWMLVGLFALIAINVPIAVSLAVVAVVAMILTQGIDILPNIALSCLTVLPSFLCWQSPCSFLPGPS